MIVRVLLAATALFAFVGAAPAPSLPRYDHVFVIVEENKDYEQMLDPAKAPHLAGLAKTYGEATQFLSLIHI